MQRHWVVWAGIFGVAVWGGWNQMEVRGLRSQIEELQSEKSAEAPVPATSLSAENQGAQTAAELIAIHAEIASLRRLIEERFRTVEGAAQAASRAALVQVANAKVPSIPNYIRNGWVDRSGIPGAVLEGFRLQLGDVPVEGAHIKQSDGKVFYSLESKTQDGRGMELALDEKGQVVMRRIEMELGGLSDGMQRTVQQAVGEIPIRRVAEVYEDGRTVYRVQAKAPNQAVELVLDSEGKVIRSETMVRETKP
ncbi:MAG: hypothetical protein NTY84_15430 [Verrucomicrobia bacterium]|nr:hypothetical protein [Verrucomicrobiota bacterium]